MIDLIRKCVLFEVLISCFNDNIVCVCIVIGLHGLLILSILWLGIILLLACCHWLLHHILLLHGILSLISLIRIRLVCTLVHCIWYRFTNYCVSWRFFCIRVDMYYLLCLIFLDT